MNTRTLRLNISYDGTDFAGWQFQPDHRTVQGCLEQALEKIAGTKISLAGASRTDSGVHAINQVASFADPTNLPMTAYHLGVNTLLPRDVRIIKAYEVPQAMNADRAFHARKDAKEKIYEYYLTKCKEVHPILTRYVLETADNLNYEKMSQALHDIVGTHDFSSFCASGCEIEEKVRTISEAKLIKLNGAHPLFSEGNYFVIRIRGNGFLKQMVRNIVGTILDIGRGKLAMDSIPQILSALDRRQAGPTAPAKGLFLMQVIY